MEKTFAIMLLCGSSAKIEPTAAQLSQRTVYLSLRCAAGSREYGW